MTSENFGVLTYGDLSKSSPRPESPPPIQSRNSSQAIERKTTTWLELSRYVGPVYPVQGVVNGSCTCGNPKCQKPGKHPWTPHGYKDATTDQTQIEKWIREKPNCNIGIATGSALCVIDVDGSAGEKALLKLQEQYGFLPETWEVLTGREGGRHLYFIKPPKIALRGRSISPGLDVKAEGGGVVGPGSLHMSGRTYRVKNESRDMQDLPEPWLEYLSNSQERETEARPSTNDGKIVKGHRNDHLSPEAYKLFRLGCSPAVVLAAIRAKNETECDPPYPDKRIIDMVDSAARNVPSPQSGPKVPQLVTDTELIQMKVEPIRWIVVNMIAPGLCFLVGKTKVGKSFLSLNLAYAIACAGQFLGNFCTELGDVIYLSLEDGLSRIQRRFVGVSGGRATGRIHFQTMWPRFDQKGFGLDFLERELDRLPDCKLVVIDTFQKIRAPKKSAKSDYEEDYRALEMIQQIALQRNIAIMLLHHAKKEKTENPLDSILGSTALPGVADSIIILERPRHSNRGTLTVIGRDLEDGDLKGALELSADRSGIWKWIGPADQARRNENDNKVLAVLDSGGKTLSEVREKCGLKQTTCVDTLNRLIGDGFAIKGEDKRYRLAPEPFQ